MLIHTKLEAPSLRARLLCRGNLIGRLSAARTSPLILISGPGGSGKTSLICQWLRRENLKAGWYALDQEDNDPDLFYRYLLNAFIKADERLNECLGAVLEDRQRLEGEFVIHLIIESLSQAPRNIHLILDDFHHIENEKILKCLTRLVQFMPASLKLVILSRHHLSGAMDAAALKKERTEITASDLRFSETETADLFKTVIPCHFSTTQIRDLNQHVEGWAAGLQLIGLSIRSKGTGSDLSYILNRAHERITNYLIHDILKMQPEKIRNFVFASALLDRFTPELCTEVTGMTDAAMILERIERMNLFLIPLDSHRKWYRYHHMFSETVRRQTAIHDPGLIPAILRRAALWFIANNHPEDAMRSAFRSNDYEFAADLMEDHIDQYIMRFDPMTGLRWILKLPSGILQQRTLLKLYQCHFYLILTEISDLKETFETIESTDGSGLARYAGDKRTLCEDFLIYLKCMLHILQADESTDISQYQALSRKISTRNPLFSIGIEMLLVLTLVSKGELSLAEVSLSNVSERLAPYEVKGKNIYLVKSMALVARHRGRLRQAEAIIGQALSDLDRHVNGNRPIARLLYRHLGHILYLQNKLPEAREYAVMAFQHCKHHSGLIDEILAGNELKLLLHIADEKYEHAVECIQKMRAYSIKFAKPQIAASADASAAKLALEQGNLAAAVLWSHRRNIQMDEPFSLLFAMECLTQTRLLYEREKYSDAAYVLNLLRNRCAKRNLMELVLQINILDCAILSAMNQSRHAVTLMREALAFSETEGYIRPFVNNSRLIRPVLRSMKTELAGDSVTSHLENVFTGCGVPLERSALLRRSGDADQQDLTQREIEILHWMEKGAQNKEIAQKTFISVNTVKSHVRSILTKLDVRTRTEAIFKARKFGIINQE